MKKWQMFARLIGRAIRFRKLPSVVAVLTVALGVGIVGGLVNVYDDSSRKMSRQFRAYGANLLIYPVDGQTRIGADTLERLARELPAAKLAGMAPVQYGIVYAENKPLVLAGTRFAGMRGVSPYWQVEGEWIDDGSEAAEAMVGSEIAEKFGLKPGSDLTVTSETAGEAVALRVKGIVATGGKEDNQIFVAAAWAGKLTGSDRPDIVLVSLQESGDALLRQAAALESRIPAIAAKPLKQMAQSEAKLVDKIRKLIFLVSAVIFVTTVLTVTTTMISMVMERRREIGLKKALGASDGRLVGEFLAEGVTLGMAGAGIGVLLAHVIAQVIGRAVFAAEIAFNGMIAPGACLGTLAVIGFAFIVPVGRIMEVEPATVLKGE